MLITQSITIALALSALICLKHFRKRVLLPTYDCCVVASRFTEGVTVTIYVIGMLFLALSLLLYRTDAGAVDQWVMYILGLSCVLVALISFCDVYFSFTALSGDEVIVKRYFVTKHIPCPDITRINCAKGTIRFCKRVDSVLYRTVFTIDAGSPNAAALVQAMEANGAKAAEEVTPDPADIQKHKNRDRGTTGIICLILVCLALLPLFLHWIRSGADK